VCVRACRLRFDGDERLSFYENDGKTLGPVEDGWADFVFSFDSLVHVEQDVIDAYLGEIARVLSPEGVAFLHHSNLAAHAGRNITPELAHWRGRSVSAESVTRSAARVGLSCFRQELVPWGSKSDLLIDSLTSIARIGAVHDRPRDVVANPGFMGEPQRALARATRWRRYRLTARRAAGRLVRALRA
jgi:SAM-dependent methyltransferase